MGKLVLCSNSLCANKVKSNIAGFKENGVISGSFGQLTTFSKIRVQTKNLVTDDKGFIAGTGTFLFNGKAGEEALRELYEDFTGDTAIRARIVGSYCIVLSYAGKVYVFVDEGATYNIYYNLSDENKKIILTNTYYHVSKGMDAVEVSEENLIGVWFRKLIDCETPIKNVYKLMGHECLIFDGDVWILQEAPEVLDDDGLDVPQKAKLLYQNLDKVFASSGVFMTGGQDSRISLALMLAMGMKPTLYYGIGNSSNTSTKTEDFNIVKSFSERFDLPIQIMNWNDSAGKEYEKHISRYGELFALYCMNENIFEEFEKKLGVEFVALGYFGEVYRTIEPIETYKKDVFTLDDFLDDIYLHDCMPVFTEGEYIKFKGIIKNQFRKVCCARNIDENHITKDQFQILNTVYRQRWDTQMNNFANQFMYSFPLFGNIQLIRKTESVPYNNRLNSKHLMECIYALKPELLEVPFFSHIKVKKYNPVTHELTNKEYVSVIKDVVRGMIRSERMMKFARNIYYTLRGDKKGRQEIEQQYADKQNLIDTFEDTIGFKKIDIYNVIRMFDTLVMNELILMQRLLEQIT